MNVSFADVITAAGKARVEREACYRQVRHERWLDLKEAAYQADLVGYPSVRESQRQRMEWPPELIALVATRRAEGAFFKVIAAEVSELLGRKVSEGAVANIHARRVG